MSLAASATLQFRAIKTLVLRRFRTRHGDSRAGYAWAVIEPLCWVFVLKFGFHNGHSLPPVGTSFEVFFATGVVMARTWRTATPPIIQSLIRSPNRNIPSISRLDTAYSMWLIDMTTGVVVMSIILVILSILGFDATPNDLMTCILAMFALFAFTIAFALFFYVLIFMVPALTHFQPILLMIIFLTSGFATVLDRMPPEFRAIVSWNPLVHLIEWFREGFYPGYRCANLDLNYAFTVTIVFLLIGLVGERAVRRRAAALRR